jgi:hypothetical protein
LIASTQLSFPSVEPYPSMSLLQAKISYVSSFDSELALQSAFAAGTEISPKILRESLK